MATGKIAGNRSNTVRKTQLVSTHVATKTEKTSTFSQTFHSSKATINRAPTIGASSGKGKGSAQAPPRTHGAKGPTLTTSMNKGKGSAQAPPPKRHATASQVTTANVVSASSSMQLNVKMGNIAVSIATASNTQAAAVSTKVGSKHVAARNGNKSAGSSQSSKKKP